MQRWQLRRHESLTHTDLKRPAAAHTRARKIHHLAGLDVRGRCTSDDLALKCMRVEQVLSYSGTVRLGLFAGALAENTGPNTNVPSCEKMHRVRLAGAAALLLECCERGGWITAREHVNTHSKGACPDNNVQLARHPSLKHATTLIVGHSTVWYEKA